MRRTLSIIALLALVALGCYSFSSVSSSRESDAINTAIQTGEVSVLEQYLDSNVELSIRNRQARCTRDEAAGLMSEFFRQNKPCGYVCHHHRNHVSGSLVTAGGRKYQVDYTLKTVNSKTVVSGLYVY